MRRDLPLGVLAAQLVHAAGESSGLVPRGTSAVVLAVPDEAALLAVTFDLIAAGVEYVLVHEPDEPWLGQAMAIGCAPGPKALFRVLSRLPLLKGDPDARHSEARARHQGDRRGDTCPQTETRPTRMVVRGG